MSVSTISQSNQLGADVLHMLFQQLEGEDLLNCETVCRQWRDILLAGTPWRRLFQRNKESSPLWRRAQRILEKNQPTLRTDQYRVVCKDILQVKCNWRTGRFTKFIYPVARPDCFALTIADDCVAWDYRPSVEPETYNGCTFLDTESMQITEIPLYCWPEIVDGLLVRTDYKNTVRTVNISNPKFNWTIKIEDGDDEGFSVSEIRSGSGLIVCESYSRNRGTRIEVWKMGNPPTLLRNRIFGDPNLHILKADERFILARFAHQSDLLYFISTETLDVFTSVSERNYQCNLYERWGRISSDSEGRLMNFRCIYNQGLLFEYRGDGLVRILDVASGTNVNDVRIPFRSKDKKFIKLLDTWVCSNSNVIVIGWKYSKDRSHRVSHLSVYDLEAVKKPNSDPGSHLLYTLQLKFDIHSFVMNETEIAFSGTKSTLDWYVTVLKFANFSFAEQKPSDLNKNPQDNKDSKKEIVKMKMKKIISDCVNFDEGEKHEACERLGEIMKKKKKKKTKKKKKQ